MKPYNPKVDAYIDKSAAFARPILEHLRKIIHDACPGVVEEIKWGIPHFDYKDEMMCILASYKQHCLFQFWKADLMKDPRLKRDPKSKKPARYLGKITALSDLPPKSELLAYIKEAMVLNEKRVKLVVTRTEKPKVIDTPDYITTALAANPKAQKIFESKPVSFRKEYVVWISSAKTESTRQKRIEQSLEWIAEGKSRFWQYQK